MRKLKQWWSLRRARALLRAYGWCPVHFTQSVMQYTGYSHDEAPHYAYVCRECEEEVHQAQMQRATNDIAAAIATLKGEAA
jgi:hypothetical protein